MTRLLLVQDDPSPNAALTALLRGEGYETRVAGLADAVLEVDAHGADVVLLELARVEEPGLALCRELRARPDIGIIVVGARGGEEDIVRALDHGADDYLGRPFGTRELVARIRAVLRRRPEVAGRAPARVIAAGPVELDPAARTATVTGRPLELPLKEFQLLEAFVRNPGRTLAREHLLGAIWDGVPGDSNTLTVHIQRLRAKIEPEPARPHHLVTVRGVGYQYLPYPRSTEAPAHDIAEALRAALTWRLPADGWLLLDGLSEQVEAAFRDRDYGRLRVAHQRIELLEPGNAIATDPAGAHSCPPRLEARIAALIELAEPQPVHRK
ncbi:CATRA system-associated protein [Dactylosporangium sp. NPDC049140]|uniref:CATRA system-associated protein n=1 Tax=Dactylosporangium sp. NPDC049140 TaxID=3155647 RepID=UPI003411A28F